MSCNCGKAKRKFTNLVQQAQQAQKIQQVQQVQPKNIQETAISARAKRIADRHARIIARAQRIAARNIAIQTKQG